MIWLVPVVSLVFLASGLALAYVIGGSAMLAFVATAANAMDAADPWVAAK